MPDSPDNVTDTTDSGLTPAEAAARLGVSERTIYRRIDKGMLQARRIDTPRGEVLRILLDGVSDSPPHPAAVVTDTSSLASDNVSAVTDSLPEPQPAPEVLKALELLDTIRREYKARVEQLYREHAAALERAHRENAQLAGQVGFLQARVQEQERQIALLMAPQDVPAPKKTEPVPQDAPAPVQRPWWRRLLG